MISASGSLRVRLFLAFTLVTLIAAVLPAFFSRKVLYEDRLALAGKQALAQAIFAGGMLEAHPGEEQIRSIFASAARLSLRLTLTDAAGRVLHDSHIGEEALPDLDNHADRPEIEEAMTRGTGISLRRGNSLGLDAVYAAAALRDGGVLRVAVPVTEIRDGLENEFYSLSLAIAGVICFCLLLSGLITSRVRRSLGEMAEVVASIAGGGKRVRLHSVPGLEFLPLGKAVNHMADALEAYVRTVGDQQSQLETILESMHEGVLVLSPSGNIRRWNKALEALFPEVKGAEGKPLIEGLPVPALQRRLEALVSREASGSGGGGGDEAAHFESPPGRFLVAHLSRPLERVDSIGAVIVIYDATEIMRLERVRRDFVSNVSHELRTPLTAVAGYAETLMNSGDLREEYRNFARIIHKHASSLAGVVRDLLALSRIEHTPEPPDLFPVDAGSSLAGALASCREQALARGLSFRIELADVRVLADASLLEQVFRNLLENACRYSPLGGEIRVLSRPEGGDVLFSVADDGPGIPREALPRVFERFYQVEKTRNSGTAGIGLAICKHIVERHGGRIWAESPCEGASTALLFLLRAAPAEEAE
ncbi:MAG: HAMP domain-containing protein [Deltaproteobacteria bacterium]|jgi:two-component system phosphate regulon sensor histidine kinase PhoR|nr:HAMP domain-containing protein [Deltaproteobacteria bacterium]